MKKLLILLVSLAIHSCGGDSDNGPAPGPDPDPTPSNQYFNPVIQTSAPDPTVIRAEDGYYYLYATEDVRNVPIYRSADMVSWTFVGTAFTNQTRPNFVPTGGIWAPEINYIEGQYVLTFSMSTWGGEWECGIGSAVSDSPAGPFTVVGNPMFISNTIGVQNSIDQTTFRADDGKLYMFWGSFHGIYGIELNDAGTAIKEGAQKRQVAGTAYEASYIYKKDGYYYLFASWGSCCEGMNSTYRVVVGRSDDLWGPYLNKNGDRMLDNAHQLVISKSSRVAGPGHNSQIVQDDAGDSYLFYHGYITNNSRSVFLDKIEWVDGWPQIKNGIPSYGATKPTINE